MRVAIGGGMLALLGACGVPLTERTVSEDESCARLEAALRSRCGSQQRFDCRAYYAQNGQDCGGRQRASDVDACEQRIRRARDCDEALNTTCGMHCPGGEWWPWGNPLP